MSARNEGQEVEQEPESVHRCQARKRSRPAGHSVEAGALQEEPVPGEDLPPGAASHSATRCCADYWAGLRCAALHRLGGHGHAASCC